MLVCRNLSYVTYGYVPLYVAQWWTVVTVQQGTQWEHLQSHLCPMTAYAANAVMCQKKSQLLY